MKFPLHLTISISESSTQTTVENNGNDHCGWFSQRPLFPFSLSDLRFLVLSSTLLSSLFNIHVSISIPRIHIYLVLKRFFLFPNDRSIKIFTNRFLKVHLAVNLIVGRVPITRVGSSNDNIYLPSRCYRCTTHRLRKRIKRKRYPTNLLSDKENGASPFSFKNKKIKKNWRYSKKLFRPYPIQSLIRKRGEVEFRGSANIII